MSVWVSIEYECAVSVADTFSLMTRIQKYHTHTHTHTHTHNILFHVMMCEMDFKDGYFKGNLNEIVYN